MIEVKLTEMGKELGKKLGISFMPIRVNPSDNGYDLRACISINRELLPDEVFAFPTGVHVYIGNADPEQEELISTGILWAGLLVPRSSNPGMKLENTIGLVDSGYQGEIFLKYRNVSGKIITIEPGQRIGQIIFIPTFAGYLHEIEEFSNSSDRGSNGFGSTGDK